jgi:hypothetical protein
MKKVNLFFVVLATVLVFASCEEIGTEVINDFEGVSLGESGYWNGSDQSGTLTEGKYLSKVKTGTIELGNTFSPSAWGGSWNGFAVSTKNDSTTSGWANQYSVIAGSGALNSNQFALVFDTAVMYLPRTMGTQKPVSLMITNSTYTYKDMMLGSDFSKKFAKDDFFKVIIKGYAGSTLTGTVEFYLADFRDNKQILVKNWTEVSLKTLGEPEMITFGFQSTDVGKWGINTPKYACIDNVKVNVLDVE